LAIQTAVELIERVVERLLHHWRLVVLLECYQSKCDGCNGQHGCDCYHCDGGVTQPTLLAAGTIPRGSHACIVTSTSTTD
jgi:hypothetical protein